MAAICTGIKIARITDEVLFFQLVVDADARLQYAVQLLLWRKKIGAKHE
jgi:hypothetical protein